MARSALSFLCKCDDACFQDEPVDLGSEILFTVFTFFTSRSRSSNAMEFMTYSEYWEQILGRYVSRV